MRKKSTLTIVERALILVPEFKAKALKMEHQVVLRGQSHPSVRYLASHHKKSLVASCSPDGMSFNLE